MDINAIFTKALLADLAYVIFQDPANPDVIVQNAVSEGRIARSLGTYYFIHLGWSIASYHPNDISGFSATIFTNGTEKVLAIRGTELGGALDTYQDLLKADLAEIGILGLAATQAVSLFNYVQRLTAPASASDVLQLALRFGDLPPPGDFIDLGELAPHRYLWLDASRSGQGLGVLQPGDRVTVTGHSLGGHLAALALRLFPSLFSEAFTFNAPGFDPPLTSGRLTDQFVGLFSAFTTVPPATQVISVADRIHTLQSESSAPGDDAEFVAGDLTGQPASTETEIATESNSHSIDQVVDALAVQNLLARLNPALSLVQISRIYAAASRQPGATDERIVEALSTVILGNPAPLPIGEATDIASAAPFDARIALHDRIVAIQQQISELGGVGLQSLLHPRNADLFARAVDDIAFRHALLTLQPFALTGDATLYAHLNDGARLDLFDPVSRSGDLTMAYLQDRAHLLQQVLARNATDSVIAPAGVHAAETYVDVAQNLSFSTDASHLGPEPPAHYRRLVFDSALPGTLTGGSADDRLYGGGGDDVLRGAGGNDYLEGGRGFDTYWWSPGDGVDCVLDIDGNGRVLLDGSLVAGGRRVASGIYRNTAGTMTYAWQPVEGTDCAPLVINGLVRIERFRNGDLGILLNDAPAALPACDYAQVGGDEADALVYEDLVSPDGKPPPHSVSVHTIGGGGNDLLITVDGPDQVEGGAGHDMILTGAGADLVDAGEGNDLVFSGRGIDVVDGGAGDDLIIGNHFLLYDTSGSVIDDQAAWEDLQGQFCWVSDGLDVTDDGFLRFLWHFELPTLAIEGLSRDGSTPFRFDPATGELHYLDDEGNTTRRLSHQLEFGDWQNGDPKHYSGGDGADLLAGADGDDTLVGGPGDDALAGNGGNDLLVGGEGNDWLVGGAGDDYLDGGPGHDSLVGEDGADSLWGGEGDDRLFGDGDDRPLWANGNDHLFGGAGNDMLVGHGGDDVLDGEDGDDTLFGGPGSDRLIGGSGLDRLQGGDGADWLDGGAGADTLHGEAGDDTLAGGPGDDALDGGDGNDLLSGDAGLDLLDGEAGDDTYLFRAGDGFDYLVDAAGSTRLVFGPGIELDDIELRAHWDDSLLVSYGQGDAAQLAPGVASRVTEIQFAHGLPVTFQELKARRLLTSVGEYGTSGADQLQGGAANDRLRGGAGDDHLYGSAGNDELSGETGADALYGGAGDDVLDGGAGDDLIVGGPGNDRLYGSYGGDVYLFAPGDGQDLVTEAGDLQSVDTLAFAEGIGPDDLRFLRQPNGDLFIKVGTRGDSITFSSWYAEPRHRVEQLAFADGSVVDAFFLNDLDVSPQVGTPGADSIVGSQYGDLILAGEGDDLIDGREGKDRLYGGPGDDTYVLGLHSGYDTLYDDAGMGTIALERGLRFDELARQRQGQDLIVSPRGSTQTGVRIADYFTRPESWRLLTESGSERAFEEIAEAAFWGDAADPVAKARAYYLDTLRAGFFETMDRFGYERGGESSVEYLPVGATVATYRSETRTMVTDYATGAIYQLQTSSVKGPSLERVRYQSGDEQSVYRDSIGGTRVRFVVETVPLEGSYIHAKRWFQETKQATSGRIHFTPEQILVDYRAPESYQYWQVPSGPLPNGVSGIRLRNETTLTQVTRTMGRLGDTGQISYPYTLYDSDFIVERLAGGDEDNVLYTSRATHTLLEGGGGNDTLRNFANWSWGTSGLFFDGGTGNDRVFGGMHGDWIVGGSDSDYLDGSGGGDRYLVDVSVRGFDVIDDTGSIWVDLEAGWSPYKGWYYSSIGLDAATVQTRALSGPALPVIPRVDTTDFAALEPFLTSGAVALDEVEFSGGLRPSDLELRWGFDYQHGHSGGLRATLNITWGDPDAGLRVVLPLQPPSVVPSQSPTPWVQPDWFVLERGISVGIERFRFGNGEVLSMAELLALAPPGPLHPDEALVTVLGTDGSDLLIAAQSGGLLIGGAGDDILHGGASPDVIQGGAGNDTLRGGAGGDLYLVFAGDGHDSIADGGNPGEIDVVKLVSGISHASTQVVRSGADLTLRFGTTGNAITIRAWYRDPAARIELVVFGTDLIWDSAELERRAVVENLAPVATDPPPVAVDEAAVFTFTLPATTFVDPDGETSLQVTATLADGAPLPSWLGFDAATLSFTGVAPLDASGVYQIALTATDSLGASALASFDLEVVDANPPLSGADASETIVGTIHPDWIDGGGGDDQISGGAGDDVLIGGPGADVLDGGDGDDHLSFEADGVWLGDRQSVNLGSPRNPSGGESIPLAGKGASSDVFIGGAGVDTLVGTDGADAVLLESGLGVSRRPGEPRISGIERFELGGGDDLLNLTSRHHAYGNLFADGGDGDDTLWTSSGDDQLTGGPGDDFLDGGAGEDLLVGGTGDDRLVGGRGSDTYRYAPGDGEDVIDDQGPPKEADRLLFEDDLTPDRLWLQRTGDDLALQVTGARGSVTVEGWYLDESRRIERIEAGDGRWLASADVERLVAAMAVFDLSDPAELQLPLGSLPMLAPVIAAAWQPAAG